MLSVKMACSLLKAFFRPVVDSDVNMPQTGRGEQEPCVE